MTTETTEEILGPAFKLPSFPAVVHSLLLSTQGGPGERGPRGTPGVRGPRGDPVSHVLGMSRGHAQAGVEYSFTGPAIQPCWCLGLSPPAFLWRAQTARALNIQGKVISPYPTRGLLISGPIQRRRICKWGQPWSTVFEFSRLFESWSVCLNSWPPSSKLTC